MLLAIGSGTSQLRYDDTSGRFPGLRRLFALGRGIAANAGAADDGGAAPDRIGAWIRELHKRGYCKGPALTPDAVDALCRYAREQTCYQPGNSERFRISEVRAGRTPEGSAVAVADVMQPLDCPQIRNIATDAVLLETAHRFLGRDLRRTRVRLYWSPVSRISSRVRRAVGQPIDFHYEVEPGTSFHAYFYLAGGTPESGAQVVIERSNRPKPMTTVLDGACLDEESLIGRYGRDSAIVVSGAPGFGFFEDPACFHKALIPTHADRLCLQIRYS